MSDVLQRADPARDATPSIDRIRAKVEERIGISGPVSPARIRRARPWIVVAGAFVLVVLVAAPALLRGGGSVYGPSLDGIAAMPGVESVTALASGGLQAMTSDADDIWVVTTLQNQLQRVGASGDILASYPIDARIEAVVAGDEYLWLLSPDDGGAAMRFDPIAGSVDRVVSLDGSPGWAHWFGDALWVSNDNGVLLEISPDGDISSTRSGELVGGDGLGYLWVNDPETDLISSLDEEGNLGAIVLPTTGTVPGTMSGAGVRQVVEADGKLWLLDGDYPWGTNLSVFDPSTGQVTPFVGLTFGLLDMTEWGGYLWVASHTDFMLHRIDPVGGEVTRFPMPGMIGGLEPTGHGLWTTLYHPGALIRVEPEALLPASPVTYDDWNRFPHRLLCTGDSAPGKPTVLLEPYDWLDYGSWSVTQARLSASGHRVCANGFVDGEASPQQRADDLGSALVEAGISGPFVLVAHGDGANALRLFEDGRNDVVGIVLVDPAPVGFQDSIDEMLPSSGSPPWVDMGVETSQALGDFGEIPLTVIEQDPDAVFLSREFVSAFGDDTANDLNGIWQDGLAFYAGLSTQSQRVVATDTGLHMVIWDQPGLVESEVLEMLDPSD